MDVEMLNRIADVLRKHNPQTQVGAVIVAMEVVQAMREPTEHMYEYLSGHGPVWRDQTSYGVWTTYIDAIIKE